MVSSNFNEQRGLQTSCDHVCLQMNWITLFWTWLTPAFFLKMKFLVIDITAEATTIYANNWDNALFHKFSARDSPSNFLHC